MLRVVSTRPVAHCRRAAVPISRCEPSSIDRSGDPRARGRDFPGNATYQRTESRGRPIRARGLATLRQGRLQRAGVVRRRVADLPRLDRPLQRLRGLLGLGDQPARARDPASCIVSDSPTERVTSRLLPPQESGWSNGTEAPLHRHRDGRVGIRLSLCYGCGRVTIGSELHSCRCGQTFAETTVAEVWPTPLELIL